MVDFTSWGGAVCVAATVLFRYFYHDGMLPVRYGVLPGMISSIIAMVTMLALVFTLRTFSDNRSQEGGPNRFELWAALFVLTNQESILLNSRVVRRAAIEGLVERVRVRWQGSKSQSNSDRQSNSR